MVDRVDLSEEAIIERLLENGRPLLPGEKKTEPDLRQAAVLIPLICQDGEWEVLFIRRTESLARHKGQVAFPGGESEPEDDSIESTALRETYEEIGISRDEIRILGRLDELRTLTGYAVTPIVGAVTLPIHLKLQHEEVARAFTIPLSWLADVNHREKRPYRHQGREDEVIFFHYYEGELLWGISAQIMVDFLIVLGF